MNRRDVRLGVLEFAAELLAAASTRQRLPPELAAEPGAEQELRDLAGELRSKWRREKATEERRQRRRMRKGEP